MAFNPVAHFRKYRTFWMASILLLTMITFVFCSGQRGDLADLIQALTGRRGGRVFAKIDGHNVYDRDLIDLKEQRNVANEFMKRALEVALKQIHAIETNDKITLEQRQKELPRLHALKAELQFRYQKPRYFESGVKLDELVDFEIWLRQADRLGINLLTDHVRIMLEEEFGLPQLRITHPDNLYPLIRELKVTSQHVPTEASVLKALNDEFRVRIAQIERQYAHLRFSPIQAERDEVRIALSPAMLWDSFKANRSTFDVTILPVEVNDFVKDVPAPTDAELKSLFQSHAKDRYDPAAPTPGFEIPTSARIETVLGDPTSAKFKLWSKTALLLETTPPAWLPLSPVATYMRYAAGLACLDRALSEQYEYVKKNSRLREGYLTAPWDEPDADSATALKLASKYPEAAVSWVGGLAEVQSLVTAQFGFEAYGPIRQPRAMQLALSEEAKERLPKYAAVIAATVPDTLFQGLAVFASLHEEKFFPLEIARDYLKEILEYRQARLWVNGNINFLRKRLDEMVGDKAKFARELRNNLDKLGLERTVTKDFYNRFDIDKAPELRDLHSAYLRYYEQINAAEGRTFHPESVLKEGDFYKLFFDPTESFSVASSTYRAKPWPPLVYPPRSLSDKEGPRAPQAQDLFATAEKPILFWKIEDKVGKIPESIELVRERVEKAWKFLRARENNALPKAKEVAEAVLKSQVGPDPVLHAQALQLHKNLIALKNVAPLYTERNAGPFAQGPRAYDAYKIPKDTFVYPRDDMAKEILALRDLKKPIATGIPRLDEINKALLEAGGKENRIVQILTNKPQSDFYVACVTRNPGPSVDEFRAVVRYAAPSMGLHGQFQDFFFDQAYDDAGNEHRRAIMEQLRRQSETEVLASEEEAKSFNQNEAI